MKEKTLTLAIACLGERLDSLIQHLSTLRVNSSLKIIICVQRYDDSHLLIEIPSHIVVSFEDTKGLSRNRNKALALANTDYVWFLDDDVQLCDGDVKQVLKIIQSGDSDFYRVKIGCIEWADKTFKSYKNIDKFRKLNLLQVSSIEIIADLNFINTHNIRFNEKIGLGTDYQGGEENHFLIDSWECGATFKHIDKVLVRHTCIFDERVLVNHKIFQIRGATASRFGLIGVALMLRWSWRYLWQEKDISLILSLCKGYLRGYSFFK